MFTRLSIALVLLGSVLTAAQAVETAASATQFLSFESVLDGRCQILSDGGKLRVMRNEHTDSAIAFRLIRQFAGVAQGRSQGVAPPGGEVVKLGCTRVDGREQDWIVERARFEPLTAEPKLTTP